jgi:hypothetical protein
MIEQYIYTLESDMDFLTAAFAQSKVSVWYKEELDPSGHFIDYGGIAEGCTL